MKPCMIELDWRVDDETHDRQYLVRFFCSMEPVEPGDWTTPASGGEVEVTRLIVLQSQRFDQHGDVVETDVGSVANRHAERVWELLDADADLRNELYEAATEQPAVANSQ